MKPQEKDFLVLLSSDTIQQRVKQLAEQIERDIPTNIEAHFICTLKGGIVFFGDLIRAMHRPITLDFLIATSYGNSTETSGDVQIPLEPKDDITGRYVILVDDIVDTGLTLSRLTNLLSKQRPLALRIACLLDKPANRRIPIEINYTGFTINDEFVFGYGLDLKERYRHLPYLATRKQSSRRDRQ